MKIAIYPGTFDPLTLGHLDVLERACRLFDKVIIAIALNSKKSPLFTKEERLTLITENIKNIPNAEVSFFEGLTVDFAKKNNAKAIIRGLRAISDFEYEFQLAQMNRHLNNTIETIFLMPNQEYFYTSSQIIKAISQHDANRIAKFVPANVLEALKKYFS